MTNEMLAKAGSILVEGIALFSATGDKYRAFVSFASSNGANFDNLSTIAKEAIVATPEGSKLWPRDAKDKSKFVGTSNATIIFKEMLLQAEAMPQGGARTKAIKKALEVKKLVSGLQNFASFKAKYNDLNDLLNDKPKERTPLGVVNPPATPSPGLEGVEMDEDGEETQAPSTTPAKVAERATSPAFTIDQALMAVINLLRLEGATNPDKAALAETLAEMYAPKLKLAV